MTISDVCVDRQLVTSGLILNLDATQISSYNGSTWPDQSGVGNTFTQYQ
ncbi:MAG: hypothetical protein Q8O99_05070 [bacterium]|nr:hypothetical protein [bacterium]